MSALVTGSTGLLARHLIPALQQRGHSVRALVLRGEDTHWLEQHDVAITYGDVRLPDTLAPAVQGMDLVFHLAGMMGVWRPMADYYAVNVTGTENVCRAALAAGVQRLVHVSSWTVYGITLGYVAHESSPLKPFPEPYAVTKAAADKLVQRMIAVDHLPAVIVRPGTFFGPGDRLHFGRMADRLRAGKGVVIGAGNNALPFVYVTDVVQGLLLAAEHERALGHAYNITHDRPLSQEAMLRQIAAATGGQAPHVHLPYAPLYAAAFAMEKMAAISQSRFKPLVTRLGVKLFGTDNRHAIGKAHAELGYSPAVSLSEGVGKAAAAYLAISGDEEQPSTGLAA